MLASMSIERYRPFKRLTIDSLARVNLIAGANDVGKTALLEAIFLLISEGNLSLLPIINSFRGLGSFQGDPDAISEWLWAPLFHEFAFEKQIKIQGHYANRNSTGITLKIVPRPTIPVIIKEEMTLQAGPSRYGFSSKALRMEYSNSTDKKRSINMMVDIQGIHFDPPPPIPSTPSYFIAAGGRVPQEEIAKDFGSLEILGRPYDIEAILRILEPRLVRISTIAGVGGPILYGDVGLDRMLPIASLGDGITRLTTMLLKIIAYAKGLILIDEIENGLYHGVMVPVWSAIAQAARQFDVQIFATTHSWECIKAAHKAFSDGGIYDFRLHRLERIGADIKAFTYDQEALDAALKAELEVR